MNLPSRYWMIIKRGRLTRGICDYTGTLAENWCILTIGREGMLRISPWEWTFLFVFIYWSVKPIGL